MRLLVTGGAGFIGSALVDRALDDGHEVDVIDDLSTGSLANLADARSRRSGALRFHHSDVAAPGIDQLVARRAPEAVVHLAGYSGRRDATPPIGDRIGTELAATATLLDAVARAGATKVVAVGHARGPEDDPFTRVHLELLWALRQQLGLGITTIDLPTVYGPRQRPGANRSVVATLADRIARGAPCVVHGDGAQRRDLVHVDDAVSALLAALPVADGLRIAIGSGVGTSVREMVDAMVAAADRDVEVVSGARRDDDADDLVVDPGRAAMYLRWSPQIDRSIGLASVVADAVQRVAAVPGDPDDRPVS